MGHIINPISYRLHNIRYWNNVWFTSNHTNYAYLSYKDYQISKLINRVFRLYFKSTISGFMIPNIKTIRQLNKTSVYIYIHDCFLDIELTKIPKFIKKRTSNIYKNMRRYLKISKKIIEQVPLYTRFLNNHRKLRSKDFFDLLKAKKKLILKKIAISFYKILLFRKLKKGYWYDVKNLLSFLLKRTGNNIEYKDINIVVVNKNYITSNMVSEFFAIRLKQRYTIWELLRGINLLFKLLMAKRLVKGYKIVCSGRFSRKQRATYSWKIFRSIAPASVKSRLDYSYRTVSLRYSACTIKVFIRRGKKKIKYIEYLA